MPRTKYTPEEALERKRAANRRWQAKNRQFLIDSVKRSYEKKKGYYEHLKKINYCKRTISKSKVELDEVLCDRRKTLLLRKIDRNENRLIELLSKKQEIYDSYSITTDSPEQMKQQT